MTVMPRDHEWTVADLENTPDDGLRYELVDGVLLVSAAPSQVHQIVLAVEVLWPSTRSVDLLLKRGVYAESGVESYWVVDPLEPSIQAWTLADGEWVDAGRAVGDEELVLDVPFPVTVRPSALLD